MYNPYQTYESVLYECHNATSDEFILATYSRKCLHVLHNICGDSVREHYGDEDVELFLHLDEENTRKLMLRLGSPDGENLVIAVKNRFGAAGKDIKTKMEEFCEENEIAYSTSVF